MTIREVIGRTRNSIKEHNADSVLTNKHIYNILLSNALLLIQREADKKSLFKISSIWQSTCIKMIPVSSVTCSCISFPKICTIFRSEEKVPRFFETAAGFLYKSISSIDSSENIVLTTPYQYNLKRKIKFET